MITGISSASILSQTIAALNNQQSTMSDLTQQLSSGLRSTDLTKFTPYESDNLINSKGLISKYESYNAAIESVQPRLSVYTSSLLSLEQLVKTTQSLVNNTQNFSAALDAGLPQQISVAIDQTAYYLNQQVGSRYIFSGTRYSTQPVGDIKALPLPPAETFPATTPTLPPYDNQAPGSNANAYTQDNVSLDDNLQLAYGIPSTDPAIQNLIQGLRFAYAASQDQSNYVAYMAQAQQYLDTALTGIRSLEADVAGNQKVLAQTKKDHQNSIDLLQTQVDAIQNANINEVATKISFYQTQLQASYAATGKLASLSILAYLPAL